MGKAQMLTSPNPFALLVSQKPEGGENIMAISWWTYISNHPPMLAAAVSQKGYTHECIEKTPTFALCVPDSSLAKEAFSCGTVSGRNVDKVNEFGIALRTVEKDFPPVVENSIVVMLCRSTGEVQGGDHVLFLAEIEKILGDPNKQGLKAYDGYRSLK